MNMNREGQLTITEGHPKGRVRLGTWLLWSNSNESRGTDSTPFSISILCARAKKGPMESTYRCLRRLFVVERLSQRRVMECSGSYTLKYHRWQNREWRVILLDCGWKPYQPVAQNELSSEQKKVQGTLILKVEWYPKRYHLGELCPVTFNNSTNL